MCLCFVFVVEGAEHKEVEGGAAESGGEAKKAGVLLFLFCVVLVLVFKVCF